ncbi:MAG: YeeE/YedE family protein [Acidiferrobacterales bacterium]
MMHYWPWWLGSLALAAITVGFWMFLRRPMGVSGSWASIVGWREARAVAQVEAPFRLNAASMGDALLAATLAEFGEQATIQSLSMPGEGAASPSRAISPPARAHWSVHLSFLAAMFAGGFIASTLNGTFAVRFDLGPVYTQLFGTGWQSWLLLMFGGSLVGFGTQMAGGCTSGHGLSGCSRLVPASMLATAIFFATAVGVSFLAQGLAR